MYSARNGWRYVFQRSTSDEVNIYPLFELNPYCLFRLEVMQLTRQHLTDYINSNPVNLTPGIKELIDLLQHKQKADVFLVSGGFRELIERVAKQIGIPGSHVYANRLLFHPTTGKYMDFDRNELTSDSGSKNVGKARVCGLLKETQVLFESNSNQSFNLQI